MQGISQKDPDELNDPCKEDVRLCGSGAKRLSGIKDKRIFHKVDGAFNGNPVPVEIVPMIGISRNTGIESKVFVGVGIDAFSIRGNSTGVFTGTNTAGAAGDGFVANPFESQGTVLATRLTKIGKRLSVYRTDRSTRSIESSVLGIGVSRIQRNTSPMETKVLLKDAVVGIGVESRIANESTIGKGGMCGKEI
jgi:hypothetical protein